MTLALDLDPETVAFLGEQAAAAGLPDASAYARRVLTELRSNATPPTPGQKLVDAMTRVETNGMTADELMELTRSEV